MKFKLVPEAVCKERYRRYYEQEYQTRRKRQIFRKSKILISIGVGFLLLFLVNLALPRSLTNKLPSSLGFFIILSPFAGAAFLVMGTRAWRSAKQVGESLIHIAKNAEPVFAYPLMCDSALMEGETSVAPALVLISFDKKINATTAFLGKLVGKISELADSGAPTAEAGFAAGLFADEKYRFGHRILLPPSLTGGAKVYACHLQIHADNVPLPLREWFENCPFLPCMATPGDEGFIEHVPVGLFLSDDADPTGKGLTQDDFIQSLATDDPQLAQIKANAQKDIPRLLDLFRQNPGYWIVSVKVPVTDPHGTEHLWMNITKIDGQAIHGTIENDPVTVKTLAIGGAISSTLGEVEDVMVFDPKTKKILLGGYHIRAFGLLPPELQQS